MEESGVEGHYLHTSISLKLVNTLKLKDFFFSHRIAMNQFTESVFSTALNP